MRNVSLLGNTVSWRLVGVAVVGALPLLGLLSACGDKFNSCKQYRTCDPVDGVAGESAGGAPATSSGGGSAGEAVASGGGAEGTDACVAGALSCQGQVVLQCQAGTWTQVGTCPLACVGEGECGGECVPNARDCVDATPRVCTEQGAWKELEACPDACSGEGNCIGQCIPETQDCLEDVPRTCAADGEWQEAVACPFVCEGAGECGGECKPEDGKCEGNVPYVCHEAGVWIAQPACEKVCSGKGECTGACKPKERDCSGKKPRVCNDAGEWDEEAACPFVCTGAGACTGECVPGTKACDGYGYKSCSAAGAYVHGECPTATPVCTGDAVCGGSCLDGTQTITHDVVLVGECCTTAKGTGFLVRNLTNLAYMSCAGVGGGLAVNKVATASSSLAANPASNVTDQDPSSVWKASIAAANEWVTVDLGESVTTRGVVFTFDEPGVYDYKVETSTTNGLVWTKKGEGTSSDEASAAGVNWSSTSARWLRITFTGLPPGTRAALASIRVY